MKLTVAEKNCPGLAKYRSHIRSTDRYNLIKCEVVSTSQRVQLSGTRCEAPYFTWLGNVYVRGVLSYRTSLKSPLFAT